MYYIVKISIHAPTRGATIAGVNNYYAAIQFQSTLPRGERLCGGRLQRPVAGISIHAPTRGATPPSEKFLSNKAYFNPRSHEGSDAGNSSLHDSGNIISIHAPTRGATQLSYTFTPFHIFQSTLPRGERRPQVHSGFLILYNFNPRSHEGSDSNFRQKVLFSLSKNCLKYLILTTNYYK